MTTPTTLLDHLPVVDWTEETMTCSCGWHLPVYDGRTPEEHWVEHLTEQVKVRTDELLGALAETFTDSQDAVLPESDPGHVIHAWDGDSLENRFLRALYRANNRAVAYGGPITWGIEAEAIALREELANEGLSIAADAGYRDGAESIVAEMVGVEAALAEAMERAKKVTATVAGLTDHTTVLGSIVPGPRHDPVVPDYSFLDDDVPSTDA